MTLENINRNTGYDVLIAPPNENKSLTVAEWFEIISADRGEFRLHYENEVVNPIVHSRHLEIEIVESDGAAHFIATEYTGRQTIQQVVEQSWKMKNTRFKAMNRAKELQERIEKAKPEKSLNEVLADLTISDKPKPKNINPDGTVLLKHQSIQSNTTQEFS